MPLVITSKGETLLQTRPGKLLIEKKRNAKKYKTRKMCFFLKWGQLMTMMVIIYIYYDAVHYGKVSMGSAKFRILNFASHFIRVQIFQIDFPLIISASKYFRQISLSFYICRGQNEQPAIPQIYLLGDEMNSCLKEGMESESEIINQIFGHHAASKKER